MILVAALVERVPPEPADTTRHPRQSHTPEGVRERGGFCCWWASWVRHARRAPDTEAVLWPGCDTRTADADLLPRSSGKIGRWAGLLASGSIPAPSQISPVALQRLSCQMAGPSHSGGGRAGLKPASRFTQELPWAPIITNFQRGPAGYLTASASARSNSLNAQIGRAHV